MQKMRKLLALFIQILILCLFFSLPSTHLEATDLDSSFNESTTSTETTAPEAIAPETTPSPTGIPPTVNEPLTILAVGDIMFNGPQVWNSKTKNGYDLKPEFKEIKKLISDADISIGNLETTIYPKKKVMGYPIFNSPIQALDALKYAGFDVLGISNNHSLDYGSIGYLSTIKHLKNTDFKYFGAYSKSKKIENLRILESKGIKVGILGYTEISNKAGNNDSGPVFFSKSSYTEISDAKKRCDFLIVYTHIGTEYKRESTPSEQKIFNQLADSGADWVINSHPHVGRKSRFYLTADNRKVLINESLGNFISNQNDKYTDVGVVSQLTLQKNGEGHVGVVSSNLSTVYRLRYTSEDKKLTHVAVESKKWSEYKRITEKQGAYILALDKWLTEY